MKKFLAILLIAVIACEAYEEITLESIWNNVQDAIQWLKDHGYWNKLVQLAKTVGKYIAGNLCKKYLDAGICNQILNMI